MISASNMTFICSKNSPISIIIDHFHVVIIRKSYKMPKLKNKFYSITIILITVTLHGIVQLAKKSFIRAKRDIYKKNENIRICLPYHLIINSINRHLQLKISLMQYEFVVKFGKRMPKLTTNVFKKLKIL